MSAGPLQGVRVLEFSVIWAGPFAGMHLADLGAEVVKVESPRGDSMRRNGAVVPNQGKSFNWLNRGKRGIVIDLSTTRGRAIIHRLVPAFDVVIVNYEPGVPERLGIGYEQLRTLRPDLIYADITGYGHEGPRKQLVASDIAVGAWGGAVASVGKVDEYGAPLRPGTNMADIPTGIHTAAGILAALYHRERTGEGQRLRVALAHTLMAMTAADCMRDPVNDTLRAQPLRDDLRLIRERGGTYAEMTRARFERILRAGSTNQGMYYRGYQASDGALVLGCLTAQNRDAARRVFGITDDRSDEPDFDVHDPANRAFLDELSERMRAILRTRPAAEWLEACEHEGVPASPVNFAEEIADDPQARLYMAEVEHPSAGTQLHVRPVFELSQTPAAIAGPSPRLGEHTLEVLREHGYGEGELDALRAEGVLG